MSTKDNGGPAFPCELSTRLKGMTLRDYMAIHASDADIERIMIENFDHVVEVYLVTRQQARYIHADAMIAEGSK